MTSLATLSSKKFAASGYGPLSNGEASLLISILPRLVPGGEEARMNKMKLMWLLCHHSEKPWYLANASGAIRRWICAISVDSVMPLRCHRKIFIPFFPHGGFVSLGAASILTLLPKPLTLKIASFWLILIGFMHNMLQSNL